MGESIVKKKFIDYIDKIIDNGRISHAYLFEVDNYEEDLTYIYSFIKMILCKCKFNELKDNDNKIISLIDSNNYPDLYVIKPDGSSIKKGQLIDLQKEYSNKSLLDNKRIYIIEECEKMNQSSANTILKFLEEPEDDVVAILIADNRYHVIDTIISRCQIISLKENFNVSEYSDDFIDFFESVLKPNEFYIKYNSFIKNIIPEKTITIDYLNKINNIIVSYLNYKNGVCDSFSEDLNILLDKYDDNYLINIISVIEDEIQKLNFNVNYKLWLDAFFAKLIIGG
ncbi:MAG: hypothetical protein IJ463_08825 [Bacilli bacterium]|nr:hypothetical protein [Bacilli bacterium]